jgi:endoribonuclease Dicer
LPHISRYSLKPIEIIAECGAPNENDLANYIRNLMLTRKAYILDHRYDPSEIYGGDEYKDELANIPDPKDEPLKYIDEFLFILNELGVYCADKAALMLLMHIEKQKVKIPYERHYLLLCLVSTTLIQIRSFIDLAFQVLPTEKERIDAFTTPKVIRILEILKLFKPEKSHREKVRREISEVKREVHVDEKCDSPTCKEIVKDLSTEKMNMLVHSTAEKIDKISEDLENLKAITTKITRESAPSTPPVPYQKNHRHNRFKNRRRFFHRPRHHNNSNEADSLCGLIFCDTVIATKTLFCLFCEVSRHDPDLKFLNVQYTVNKTADPITEAKEAEAEHRKQEEVLKKFRMHECNLLLSTAVLEEGFDLPKCNLVVRWDPPKSYRSYVQCKGRAKASNALHVIMIAPQVNKTSETGEISEELTEKNHKMVCEMTRPDEDDSEDESETSEVSEVVKCVVESPKDEGKVADFYEPVEVSSERMIEKMAEYMEIEKMLIRKCENKEPPATEISHADKFTSFVQSYQPRSTSDAQVSLATAIALVNKYCAKLPSDTFTKLTPIWRCCKTVRNGITMHQYTLRLPLNSPMKHDIVGIPMPTRTLARRVAALIACRILHKSGELDDNLQPIGKEGFRAIEPDWEVFELDKIDEEISGDSSEPRPGTTKRRQYYYKRIASVFSACRPTTKTRAFLYHITMVLQCPIPEEQNTRGRKIYPPEDAVQSFGILTTKRIPNISAFPIFTRSGEVKVSLQLIKEDVQLNDEELDKVNNFINYTFTNVLRLRKYLMLFDPEAIENSFFVVPVTRESGEIDIDWKFLALIQQNVNTTPQYVSDEVRNSQPFDHSRFVDAVVMPWYRNQDQPQNFYVAEICQMITPESSFPGENYTTFREYYFKKYNIEIQNKKQPLLDVDHTSARLNFLTPRYVNRKGVALPTSSEETKRAKRENLEQKQILVPELCTVHPFPASLWRAAVCLPCVLYRINALLLADEIRMEVSRDLGLGTLEVKDPNFKWPMLDFGWTLADVLKKTREAKEKLDDEEVPEATKPIEEPKEKIDEEEKEKSVNDIIEEADEKVKSELEIGMWSNEMAKNIEEDELGILPRNLEMCSSRKIRYGSPTSWDVATMQGKACTAYQSDSDELQSDDDLDSDQDTDEDDEDEYGLRIEFKSDHLAEAVETEEEVRRRQRKLDFINETIAKEKHYEMIKNKTCGFDFIDEANIEELEEKITLHQEMFEKSTAELRESIKQSGVLVKQDEKIPAKIRQSLRNEVDGSTDDVDICDLVPFLDRNEVMNVTETEQLTLDDLYELNSIYENRNPGEEFEVIGSGDVFDYFADSDKLKLRENGTKTVKLTIKNDLEKFAKPTKEDDEEKLKRIMSPVPLEPNPDPTAFSFDFQPDLTDHPGPSPSIILQALTMSNANDGINLERLETIGDSFLKYAITNYLYCTYENVNEGKLSYLRSKQVSNLNLYRLGRRKVLGESMIATKFEPHDNWLPPCYFVPKELEQALIDAKVSFVGGERRCGLCCGRVGWQIKL